MRVGGRAQVIADRGGPSTIVWYDATGVTVVLDDTTRRDMARLDFRKTPQFENLIGLDAHRPGYGQRDFRRLLRVDLAGCLESGQLLNWVSSVQFGTSVGTKGQLRGERESLGSDVEAQAMSDAGEIPDRVPLTIRLFDDPSLQGRQGVACLFELTIQDQLFRLIPLPLELHSALEREIAFVGEKLAADLNDDVPLFRGRP